MTDIIDKKSPPPEVAPADLPAVRPESNEKTDIQKPLKRLYTVGKLMDAQFDLPVVGGIGLDPIIGMIPVAGDITSYLVSVYIIVQAGRMGVPAHKIARMSGNAVIDVLTGYVPVIGDFVDVAYKANARNVNIILDHFEAEVDENGNFKRLPVPKPEFTTKAKIIIWSVILLVILLLAAMIAIPILIAIWLFSGN